MSIEKHRVWATGSSAIMLALVCGAYATAAAQTAPAAPVCDTPEQKATQECIAAGQGPAAETPAPATAEGSEEVVVTGSRIRRTEFTSSSPIQVINSEATTLEGLADTAEILQGSNLASGSQQINNQLTGFVAEGGPGVNTISLRGLGAQRTLVMVNSKRLAPAGTRGQVGAADLNVLPTSIIDRIEILKDGASSIYGSDAVAGVVNVITRKNLDGGTLGANYNVTEAGGGTSYLVSGAWGKEFENGHFSISGEYNKREELRWNQRDFLSCSQDLVLNNTTQPTSIFAARRGTNLDIIDPATGRSKCFNILDAVADRLGTAPVTAVSGGTGGRFIPNAAAVAGGGPFGLDLAGWQRVGLSFAQVQTRLPAATLQQQLDAWYQSQAIVPNDPVRQRQRTFVSPVERYSLFLEGSYEFSTAAEVYSEVLYAHRSSEQESFRQLFPNVAANNPSNPFGVTSRSIVTIPTNSSQKVDFLRATLGVRGDFSLFGFDDWGYDAYVLWSKADAEYTNDIIYNDRVLATTSGPLGCNAALINISAGQPNGACTNINWFNPATITGGAFSPAEAAFLFTKETGTTEYTQTMAGLSFAGSIAELPAGRVGFALGFEWRKDEIDDTPGFNARNNNLWGQTSAGRTAGSDTVKEVYAEIEVPLVKDFVIAKELTLTASGRYTDYDSYGTNSTYKVGLNWRIIDSIRIRGTTGTSYRAPALYELFLANQTAFTGQTAIDPCLNWNLSSNPLIVQNCGPGGDNLPPNWANANSSALVITGGGAGVLTAETSKADTLGLIWTPDAPFSIALDYFKITVDNQVAQFGSANIVNQCYSLPNRATNVFCTLFNRELNPAAPNFGQITTVNNSYVNIAKQVVEGLDLTFEYRQDFGENWTVRLRSQFSWLFKDTTQTFRAFPETDNLGTIYNNQWVGNSSLRVDYKDWTFTWSVDMFSPTSNDALFGGDTFGWRGFPNCATSPTSTTCVSGLYNQSTNFEAYHAFSVRYIHEDTWSIVAGVQNIFDEPPPILSTGSGATRLGNAVAISNYDPLGRRFFLTVNYEF